MKREEIAVDFDVNIYTLKHILKKFVSERGLRFKRWKLDATNPIFFEEGINRSRLQNSNEKQISENLTKYPKLLINDQEINLMSSFSIQQLLTTAQKKREQKLTRKWEIERQIALIRADDSSQ